MSVISLSCKGSGFNSLHQIYIQPCLFTKIWFKFQRDCHQPDQRPQHNWIRH